MKILRLKESLKDPTNHFLKSLMVDLPLLRLLLAAARLTVVFVFAAQSLCVAEVPAEESAPHGGGDRGYSIWPAATSKIEWSSNGDNVANLRQCVMDVFCSTSTERSRKSSSLLLTCQRDAGEEET